MCAATSNLFLRCVFLVCCPCATARACVCERMSTFVSVCMGQCLRFFLCILCLDLPPPCLCACVCHVSFNFYGSLSCVCLSFLCSHLSRDRSSGVGMRRAVLCLMGFARAGDSAQDPRMAPDRSFVAFVSASIVLLPAWICTYYRTHKSAFRVQCR